MATKRLVLAVGLMVPTFSAAWANDRAGEIEGGTVVPAVKAATGSDLQPWIHPTMRPNVDAKIDAAFAIAVARVRDNAFCQALFARLESNGVDVLRTSLYYPMPVSFDGISICERGYAATLVGAPTTFICRNFQRLSDERAALVLIHEALHHAGLTEYPLDPDGMTSSRINRMVEKSCRH
jgi:hypothetical protein